MATDSESFGGWTDDWISPSSASDSTTSSDIEQSVDDIAPEEKDQPEEIEPPVNIEMLRKLISSFLGARKVEISSHQDKDKFKFKNLAGWLCKHNSLEEWLSSKSNAPFLLQLPAGLDHPMFFSALLKRLTLRNDQYLAVAVEALERLPEQANGREYLLASLCNMILQSWEDTLYIYPRDLWDNLQLAFRGFNTPWREETIWELLRWLINERPKAEYLIVMSFCGSVDRYHKARPLLQELTRYISLSERRLKLLIIPPAGESLVLARSSLLKVDLTDPETKAALLNDIQSWIDIFLEMRPSFKKAAGLIETNFMENFQDPFVLISYLRHLESQGWMNYSQLEERMVLLSSADSLTRSILDTILVSFRSSAGTILSMIHYATRSLTAAEFSAALALEIASAKSESINQYSPLDIEYVIRRSLAGLLYEKEGYVYILHPSLENILNQKIPDSGLSWLDTKPQAEMKMASVCHKNISTWARCQDERNTMVDEISVEKWPLLEYAVRFWHEQFEWGMDAGTEEIKLFVQDWGVVKSWMKLWLDVHPWAEGKYMDLSTRRLSEIASSFKIAIPKAIYATLLTLQVLPFLGGDEELAVLWVAWHLNNDRPIPESWKQKLEDSASLSTLLKILPLAPLEIFQLFDGNETFVTANVKTILPIALQQGVIAIVKRCWPLVVSDEAFISQLPWVSCARSGNISALKILVNSWPKIKETRDMLGSDVLRGAVQNGQIEAVKLLLSCDFNLDPIKDNLDSENENLVLVASQLGFLNILELILEKRPNISVRNEEGYRALEKASELGHAGIVKVLLDHGTPMTSRVHRSESLLIPPIKYNHIEIVKHLMEARRKRVKTVLGTAPAIVCRDEGAEQDTTDAEEGDILDRNVMQCAAKNGVKEAIVLLLEQSAPDAANEQELLHYAAEAGHLELVKFLITLEDIDINKRNSKNHTALHLASWRGHVRVVNELIAQGAKIWTRDDRSNSPLDDALRLGHEEIAQTLLSLLDKPDSLILGTALSNAVKSRNQFAVSLLLNKGADKDFVNQKMLKRTPLHIAAEHGQQEVIQDLLMCQATINFRDENGDTPLSVAASAGNHEIVRMLLKAGADIDSQNNLRYSSLDRAALNDKKETVKLLLDCGATFDSGRFQGRYGLLERIFRHGPRDMVETMLPYVQGLSFVSKLAHVALREDNTSMLTLLLNHGADLNAWNAKGPFGTALEECAYYGNLKMAKFLLSRPDSVKVDQTGGRFHTPLIASVCLGEKSAHHLEDSKGKAKEFAEKRFRRHKKMFDFLLEKGADVSNVGGIFGNVLNASAACASLKLMCHVIDQVQLPLDWPDAEGRTMAHLAYTKPYGSINKLCFLKKKGGQRLLQSEDNLGRRPLHFASGSGMTCHVLNQIGIEHVSARDHDGWTPLHWACRQRDGEALVLLIKYGADISVRTNDNWTPWHVAVYHGNENFGRILDVDKYKDEPDLPKSYSRGCEVICDSCFVTNYGNSYNCNECPDFNFCFKCYRHSQKFHVKGHTFTWRNNT